MISSLNSAQWLVLLLSAFLIGADKAGLKSLTMISVILMAEQFEAKLSTGLVLPLLLMADVLAVRRYNRSANWWYVLRLLPAAVLGVLLGVFVGQVISPQLFKMLLACVVLAGLALVIVQERQPIPLHYVQHPLGAGLAGLLGGFTTMVGNAAGPVMGLYLLAAQLPKQVFLGTSAWFFMTINVIKIPFHIWSWKTLSWQSLALDVLVFPFVLGGFLVGVRIVGLLPERLFRLVIMLAIAMAAIKLLVF